MKTKALFGVLAIFLMNSCGGGADPINPMDAQLRGQVGNGYAYRSLTWQTSGGGNLTYSITPNAAAGGSFTITITSYDFRNPNQTLTISSTDPLYQDLQNLFSARITIETRGPDRGLTGSWSKVIIIEISGHQREIQSPDLNTPGGQALNRINDYVRQQAEGGGGTVQPIDDGGVLAEHCKGIYDIAGIWRTVRPDGTQTISVIRTNEYYRQGFYGDQEGLFYRGDDTILSPQGHTIGFQSIDYYHFTPSDCQIYQVKNMENRRGQSFKILSAETTPGRRRITLKVCEDNSCRANKKGPEQVISLSEMTGM